MTAPTRRRLAAAEGIGLSVLEGGPADGPLVILLHGFPEDARSWAPQIEALATAGLRVAAPDQRGYGDSDRPRGRRAYRLDLLADDVAALAASLGRERICLVGHDWGGVVAWWFAVRHAERLDRLVILNAPHPSAMTAYMLRAPSQILRSAYMAAFQLPAIPEALLRMGDGALLARVLRRSSRPGTFPPAELDRLRASWNAPGAMTAMLNWYRALGLKPGSSSAHRVHAPTLVLWGARDAFLQRGLAQASAAFCDRPQLRMLEDAGHWVQREAPQAVDAALTAFLTAEPEP